LQSLNLALRFFIEIAALIIYGSWAYQLSDNSFLRIIYTSMIVLGVAVLWGTFGSPKAPVELSNMMKLIFELVVFLLPVLLLFISNKPWLAITYGGVYAVNKILMVVWEQAH
jgi:hypothetical protein